MSDEENFLARWSRRKRETGAAQPQQPQDAQESRQSIQGSGEKSAPPAGGEKAADEKPALDFDITKLPPLESITAQTDIRMFLQPGVPAELSRAALRRAWSADPGIRDFIGLAENQWDFTAPNAIAGFGPLGPDVDVAKLVADVFGNVGTPEPKPEAAGISEAPQTTIELDHQPSAAMTTPDEASLREAAQQTAAGPADIASQQKEPAVGDQRQEKFHRHGGATPKNISDA